MRMIHSETPAWDSQPLSLCSPARHPQEFQPLFLAAYYYFLLNLYEGITACEKRGNGNISD